jgi:lysozyme
MRRSLFGVAVIWILAGCIGQGTPPHAFVDGAASVSQALHAHDTTICPAGTTQLGADVSSYQPGIQWSAVAQAGLTFSIAKATEGTSVQDSEFAANWSGMKAAGMTRGAYHYFHSSDDGAAQADYFLAMVNSAGGFQPGDLPPFLDWEEMDSATAAEEIQVGQNFIDEIQAKTGMTTVIYSYLSFVDSNLGNPPQLGVYPLWMASYDTCPDIPAPWTAWQFWQNADTEPNTGGDADQFNGTLAQLQAFGGDGGAVISTSDGGTALPDTVMDQASGNDAVTLVNWTDGHVGLFAKTPAGAEEYSATTGTGDSWSALVSLDTGADCGSAAAFWGASYLYPELYSPLSAGGTGHLWNTNGTWNSYQSLAGSDLSHLSTVVWPSGLVEIFAVDLLHGTAWHNYFDVSTVSWVGWASLGTGTGGALFSQGPRPLVWSDGHGELYEVDTQGNVWRSTSASGDGTDWTAFAQIGTGIASRLSPVRWPDGTVELFGTGTDGNVWRAATGPAGAGGFTGFSILATQATIGEPSAFMNPGGGAEVIASDPSGNLLDIAYSVANGSWPASFTRLGETAASPFGWIRGDGNAEVFAVDGSGALVHSLRSSGTWSSWTDIGTGIDACATAVVTVDGGVSSSSSSSGGSSSSSSSSSSSGSVSTSRGGSSSSGSGSRTGSSGGSSSGSSGTSSGAASSEPAVDAGSPANPVGKSGCGCSSSNAASSLLWIFAALALLGRRKPSIQPPL